MIAGFDVESVQLAADNTTYDNGYGIALVPKTHVTTGKWNTSSTVSNGYKGSSMHTNILPTVATNLKKVLGSHLIQRNVLLSTSISSTGSNAYAWTTSYATLMSVGQMTGTFAKYDNKYDDGEADYQLPIFKKIGYSIAAFWTRGIWAGDYDAWYVDLYNTINHASVDSYSYGVRPLIYIR